MTCPKDPERGVLFKNGSRYRLNFSFLARHVIPIGQQSPANLILPSYFIYPTWNWVPRLLPSGQMQHLSTLGTFNNNFIRLTPGQHHLQKPHLLQDRLNQAKGTIRLQSTSLVPSGSQGSRPVTN